MESLKKIFVEMLKRFGKAGVFFVCSIVFAMLTVLSAAFVHYDIITADEVSLASGLFLAFYALVPVMASEVLYDFLYKKNQHQFKPKDFLSRLGRYLLVWGLLCLLIFDDRFVLVSSAVWVIFSYVVLSYQEDRLSRNIKFSVWAKRVFTEKKTMKKSYTPFMVLIMAVYVYNINPYVFWLTSPFFIWWVNGVITSASEAREWD